MAGDRKLLEDARGFVADMLSRVSGEHQPEIDHAFRAVRREDFFPAGSVADLRGSASRAP
jgi:hypothetical protein